MTSCKYTSLGGNKYWSVWIDYATNFVWSIFLKNKSDLIEKGLTFIEERPEELNKEYMLIMRCDNAQENISLKNKVKINKIKNVKFEFTSPGTPQQNGKVERMIATLWSKMRAVNHQGMGDSKLRHRIYANILDTLTNLQNITISEIGGESAYEKLYNTLPKWSNNLKIIGEMAIVKLPTKIFGKQDDRGRLGMMLGYQTEGPEASYKFYILNTKK